MKSTGLFQIENNDATMKINTDTRYSLDGGRSTFDSHGFVRYRENSVSSDLGTSLGGGNCSNSDNNLGLTGAPNEDDIAKFCEESNYSYSFATILGMKRLSYIRRRSCERNLDCLRIIRSNLDGLDSGRRFSQPDMGVMDKQRSPYEFLSRQQCYTSKSKHKARHQHFHVLTDHNNTGGFIEHGRTDENNLHTGSCGFGDTDSKNTYSSLPASPIFWDYDREHEISIPEENESQPTLPHDKDNQQHSSTILHPLSCQAITISPSTATRHYSHNDEALTTTLVGKSSGGDSKSLSSNDTSSTGSNVDINNITISAPNHNASCAPRYLRALHTPTRFLPQQQAILTTDADGNLLLFNDIACLCLGIDKSYIGQPIFSKFGGSAQRMVSHRLRERKQQLQRNSLVLEHQQPYMGQMGIVLMCGVIIPIIKTKGQKSAASLWLKEKWNQDQSRFVYLWIFEEIFESRLTLTIDIKGMIQDTTLATIQDIYGYQRQEVIGQPINKILPALDIESNDTQEQVNKNRFYASRSKNGKYFPSMVQLQDSELQITSLPTISGLITVHQSGMVQSMNPVPAKYLFGYKTKGVVETMHIDDLLPQFMTLVNLLRQQHLLRHNRMVTFEECLDILHKSSTNSMTPTTTTTSITAIHRDGSRFDVELQIRWVESADENLYSVWITYDRVNSLTPHTDDEIPDKTAKRTLSENQPSSNQHSATSAMSTTCPNIFTTNANITSSTTANETKDTEFYPKCGTIQQNINSNSRPMYNNGKEYKHHHQHQQQQQQEQLLKQTSNRFESFGSVPKEKALFPDMQSDSSPTQSFMGPSSILFPEFDDYVVIDSLGEGTYGAVKLVYLKSDPSQEFVIKAIMKSRIIIDSWVRDRKHGSIPTEVHILLKLQQHLHVNCPQLVTFFEDDDNYYTVTKLHGDGMDLFDYTELNDEMTEGQVRHIFHQVAAAVQHLHHLRIVHRDIKDENILLNEHGIVQLIDFGSAAYYREGRLFDTFSGTLDHSSPEALNGTPYAGPPQDMWSLGILLYTLIYRETPFYSVDDIMERNLQLPYIPYPEKANGPVGLLCKLLDRDVNKRPTIDQVMQDPWLQNGA
ncbi:hypothetical protein BCR42DRAFT_481621 [Absidia repens]|uniref:Protein kinase domain-containing protein n=1 Tax=Absidia repens TaxID=90262 RepID=A0A1X2IND5_9FUNG|nr:hypothetical protein BCR42DRAFT_481621 [Absidia repens]